MSTGRIGTAPCGHPGEALVGQYYICLQGCDRVRQPEPSYEPDFELVLEGDEDLSALEWMDGHKTKVVCPYCGSDDIADDVPGAMPNYCYKCAGRW